MDKKVKIIEAATKVFAKEGFQDASVDEIVKIAEVAKGTFYYYFKSKDDLFLALIGTGTDKLSEKMVEESNKSSDPIEKIKTIINSLYNFFGANQDLCLVLLSEIWGLESKWRQKYSTKRDQYVKALKQAIEVGQKDNIFDKKIDSKIASIAIFGMVATSALDYLASGKKLPGKTKDTITKIAVNGLLNTSNN